MEDYPLCKCPHCGEKERLIMDAEPGHNRVYCIACQNSGPEGFTELDAVKAWNARYLFALYEHEPDNFPHACPYCGNSVDFHLVFEDFSYYVKCDKCGARSFRYTSLTHALAAWNRRDAVYVK